MLKILKCIPGKETFRMLDHKMFKDNRTAAFISLYPEINAKFSH